MVFKLHEPIYNFFILANKISITTPIITKVEENNYTTCIYLPKTNQKTAPEPTNQDLYIHKKSNLKIFKL